MEIKLCSSGNCYYKELDLQGVQVKRCGCLGFCGFAPVAIIKTDTFSKILPLNNNLIKILKERPSYIEELDSLTFEKDSKILMKNNDEIDPEDIDSYILVGGFKAFEKALSMEPQDIIKEIELSGLKGRGGAAFPSYKKIEMVMKEEDNPKYIVANLEEGEISSFNNTILAESNPFSIIEGMLICARVVGASKGFIFVNHKAKLAIRRLENAIEQTRKMGFLSKIGFELELRRSPSSYIAGEETAMLEVLEGKKAYPRNKPPFPVSKGLFKKPTLIHNVETLAAITYIILYGHKYYTSFGKDGSFGTKMISLTGNVNNPCVNEVPFNVTIKDIIEKIGMGYREENKGFLVGGPSGGIIPQEFEESHYTYEDIRKTGAMVGSGAIFAIGKSVNIPEFVAFLMKFFAEESCGQCIPCRVGTVKLTAILENFVKGKDLPANLDEINEFVMNVSLCGLGQAAPVPLITAMKYFPQEFKARHLVS